MDKKLKRFLRDRDAALMSLDKAKICAYLRKYGESPHPNEEVFWRGIHKARTACKSLPMTARVESAKWLIARGSEPMDDGEVRRQLTVEG